MAPSSSRQSKRNRPIPNNRRTPTSGSRTRARTGTNTMGAALSIDIPDRLELDISSDEEDEVLVVERPFIDKGIEASTPQLTSTARKRSKNVTADGTNTRRRGLFVNTDSTTAPAAARARTEMDESSSAPPLRMAGTKTTGLDPDDNSSSKRRRRPATAPARLNPVAFFAGTQEEPVALDDDDTPEVIPTSLDDPIRLDDSSDDDIPGPNLQRIVSSQNDPILLDDSSDEEEDMPVNVDPNSQIMTARASQDDPVLLDDSSDSDEGSLSMVAAKPAPKPTRKEKSDAAPPKQNSLARKRSALLESSSDESLQMMVIAKRTPTPTRKEKPDAAGKPKQNSLARKRFSLSAPLELIDDSSSSDDSTRGKRFKTGPRATGVGKLLSADAPAIAQGEAKAVERESTSAAATTRKASGVQKGASISTLKEPPRTSAARGSGVNDRARSDESLKKAPAASNRKAPLKKDDKPNISTKKPSNLKAAPKAAAANPKKSDLSVNDEIANGNCRSTLMRNSNCKGIKREEGAHNEPSTTTTNRRTNSAIKQEEAVQQETQPNAPAAVKQEEGFVQQETKPPAKRRKLARCKSDLGSKVVVEFPKALYPAYIVMDKENNCEMLSRDGLRVMIQWMDTGERVEMPISTINRAMLSSPPLTEGIRKRRTRRNNNVDYAAIPGLNQDKDGNLQTAETGKREAKATATRKRIKSESGDEAFHGEPKAIEAKARSTHPPSGSRASVKWGTGVKPPAESSSSRRVKSNAESCPVKSEDTRADDPSDSLDKDKTDSAPREPRRKLRYPHAKQMDVVVNRYMPARPKPKRLRLPPKPEIGSIVWLVDQTTFHSRRAKLDELYQKPPARVVGESFFGFGINHERLLQLRCEESGERWYVTESEVSLPHIMDR